MRKQVLKRSCWWIRELERFWYDLEMKTSKQNRNNKRTERERFDWFIERIQRSVAFGWLSERSSEKTPENFLEINRYFALTSYCNTTGQSNNASSILGFSLAGKQRVHVLIFSSIDLWNRWRTLTETIFQGHRKIALTWPLPESTKTMFKQYRIAFAPARKPYRIGFCSHIRTVVVARFR